MAALLEVENVSVSFGGLRALNAVSLEVPERSVVGLIGPNGSGKTTLFNVISGLQKANQGTVRFGGRDITALPSRSRARLGIGRSFQNLGLMADETVRTNVLAAQYLTTGYRAWDLLMRPWRWWSEESRVAAQGYHIAESFNLTEHWDRRVSDLSFGAARFVELACVMIGKPRLLLLDEPTTGLDVIEVQRLLTALRLERASETAILVVAHDVKFVMDICDHVYVLETGNLLFDGPPSTVQREPRVIDAYLGRSA